MTDLPSRLQQVHASAHHHRPPLDRAVRRVRHGQWPRRRVRRRARAPGRGGDGEDGGVVRAVHVVRRRRPGRRLCALGGRPGRVLRDVRRRGTCEDDILGRPPKRCGKWRTVLRSSGMPKRLLQRSCLGPHHSFRGPVCGRDACHAPDVVVACDCFIKYKSDRSSGTRRSRARSRRRRCAHGRLEFSSVLSR